jgi:hypothetical protein
MKDIVLILALFLSLLNSCGKEVTLSTASCQETAIVADDSGSKKTPDYLLHKDMCITSPQGWAFSGGENGSPVSIRTSQSGRRVNQPTKNTTRLFRSGKVIDTHNFDPFLSALFPKVYGIQSFSRFIYAICCLRL